jgi:hypothetical protein
VAYVPTYVPCVPNLVCRADGRRGEPASTAYRIWPVWILSLRVFARISRRRGVLANHWASGVSCRGGVARTNSRPTPIIPARVSPPGPAGTPPQAVPPTGSPAPRRADPELPPTIAGIALRSFAIPDSEPITVLSPHPELLTRGEVDAMIGATAPTGRRAVEHPPQPGFHWRRGICPPGHCHRRPSSEHRVAGGRGCTEEACS